MTTYKMKKLFLDSIDMIRQTGRQRPYHHLAFKPKCHLTEKELSSWHSEITDWMDHNLKGGYTCDWEFGCEIPDDHNEGDHIDADFYLIMFFDNEEDKVKFILKWI